MADRCRDLSLNSCEWLDLKDFENSTILVTGGTGLVGHHLLEMLAEVKNVLNLTILALVRDKERAKSAFSGFSDKVELVVGDVMQEPIIDQPIHYIIHSASITSSKAFIETPVDTILTSVFGLRNMLELSRKHSVRSMVYLSSMEAYGTQLEDKLLKETDVGYLNPLKLRSSYPESKRMCESLCVAYAAQYGINVKIARLAQTIGPGIRPDDRRVIVQFLESAKNNRNIEIKTSGESARMYLFTFDAATALLTLLLKGEAGEAYNVANKDSYCSVRQLAQRICDQFSPQSSVLVNTGSAEEQAIYPTDTFLRLDTTKIERLGWRAVVSLDDSLHRLMRVIEERMPVGNARGE